MAEQTPSSQGGSPTAVPRPGVSAFVAKVLDQLSLSAWLPGIFFAVAVVIVAQFRSAGSADVSDMVHEISRDWVAVLVFAIPTLLLSVLVIQASSFAAIQFLEGYGAPGGPGRWVRSGLIRWQVRRLDRLHGRRMREQARAFDFSEERWSEPAEVVIALWADSRGREVPKLSDEHRRQFERLDWRDECDPWRLARIEELKGREDEYPALSRILPTRLGNLLRATEDNLDHGGDDVGGFALRRREHVPPRTQLQHDQFRERLDMYATLTVVNVILIPVTAGALFGSVEATPIAIMAVLFAMFAVVSYRAAIASARGYCAVLRVMDEDPAME